MNSPRKLLLTGYAILLSSFILFGYACSREDAKGQGGGDEKAASETASQATPGPADASETEDGGPVRVTGRPGYDHPGQYLTVKPTTIASNSVLKKFPPKYQIGMPVK